MTSPLFFRRTRGTGHRLVRGERGIRLLPLLVWLVMAGCGGGGGGGGGNSITTPTAGISVASTDSESATLADTSPQGQVAVEVAYFGDWTTEGVYIQTTNTNNAIESLSVINDVSVLLIVIHFKSPATLGVGTYHDTIGIRVCYDQACTRQVNNSPANVAVTFVLNYAPPFMNFIQPGSLPAGSAAFTLQVNGQFIDNESVVLWNGSPRPTTYVSSTQLNAQIQAADVANVGNDTVTISNPSEGTPPSAPATVTVLPPYLTTINPVSVVAGAPGVTLTVSGSDFVPQSALLWNGSARTTTFVSSTQLSAQITTTDLLTAGTASVAVANGNGSGATSTAQTFTVLPLPALSLTSVSPNPVYAGGPAFTLTLLGSGFTAYSTVSWNGSARATTYVSNTEMLAQIPATDIATPGSAPVVVTNPPSQGGATPPVTVTVKPASIDAVAFQITPQHSGAVSFNSASLPAGSTWSVDVGGQASYALIADGNVFVTVTQGSNSELLALDQKTGATVWGPISLSGLANAAYDSGSVFVVSTVSGQGALVQSFDSLTGQKNWAAPLTTNPFFNAAPTAADGLVYVVAGGATVYALNESTGSTAWTAGIFNGGDYSAPAVTSDTLFLAYPCWAYAIRPATGETIWSNTTGCYTGGGATPVVANGVLYAPNETGTYNGGEFNAATGAVLGKYTADNPPAVGTLTAYMLQSGTLRAITLSSGAVTWSFTGDGTLVTSPLLINQWVIVGSSSGALFGLDAGTGAQLWQVNAGASLPRGAGWDSGIPLSSLSAGDGLLVVPAGTTVTAYTISTSP